LTPFAPYRESVVILRYNTLDLVQQLDKAPNCSLRSHPATSDLLGKQRLSVRHSQGWTYPRDVLEALEGVTAVPLPARCSFWEAGDGVEVEVVVREVTPATRQAVAAALEAHQVPLRALHLLTDPAQLRRPLPWRGDMHERSLGEGGVGV
jgi:hypothetical protein